MTMNLTVFVVRRNLDWKESWEEERNEPESEADRVL
jgi:hypothetical protein